MDFLDPKQKRAHEIRLYIGYVLVAVIILCSTWLLSYFSFGYNYDPKTKSVVQNGLVFLDSHPESARAYINDQDKGVTDLRLVLPVGDYKVSLKRDGYRTWSHDMTLYGRSVERLVYPFLFPEKLVSEDAELFASAPSLATQSPDRRWLITKHADKINDFELIDLAATNIEPQFLSVNPALITQEGAKHNFSEVEWSTNNRHVLIEHSFDAGSEFLLIDRENPSAAINLNKRFNRPVTSIRLRDKKPDKFYLYDSASSSLVVASLSDLNFLTIASRVLAFAPHGDNIVLYAASDPNKKDTVNVRIHDGDKDYILRELPKSSKYLLDLAQFDGAWYVAAGSSEDKKVYVYIDPFNDLKREQPRTPQPTVLLRLNTNIEYLSFSANTRFIAVQSGSNFAVFDAENVRQYKYDVGLKYPVGYKVKWMDGHRLTAVSEGNLNIFDFDGTNKQTLVKQDAKFYPFFDRDYNKMFTVSPSILVKDKTAIVSTSMRSAEDDK